jgi:plastocyanin
MKLTATIVALLAATACSTTQAPKASTEPPAANTNYTKVDPATAGSIKGRITLGTKPRLMNIVNLDEDPECAKLQKVPLVDNALVVDGATKGVANVFVYVKEGLEGKNFEPSQEPANIVQEGCWFAPRVVGVQVGQPFRVINSDPLTHNIHPLAQVNREWNQSQEAGAQPLTRKFTKREVMVRVKCNIHQWMRAWVGVVEHPYFQVTGADGSYELKNLPPGDYVLEVWHEELGTRQAKVTVGPSGKPVQNIAF